MMTFCLCPDFLLTQKTSSQTMPHFDVAWALNLSLIPLRRGCSPVAPLLRNASRNPGFNDLRLKSSTLLIRPVPPVPTRWLRVAAIHTALTRAKEVEMRRFGLILTAYLALWGLPAGAISMEPAAVSPGLVEVIEDARLRVEIAAPALFWTPSAENALRARAAYGWYVQRLDDYGEGPWPEGRILGVDVATELASIEWATEHATSKYLANQEVLDESLKAMSISNFELRGIEGPSNVLYGDGAGSSITTGSDNTFIGVDAGNNNQDGYRNTFVGRNAGKENTNGYDNSFFGMNAGHQNSSGEQNTFLGRAAGYANTDGGENVFVGYGAGNSNDVGHYNTFAGHVAGWSNAGGSFNCFIGKEAGWHNTSGYMNTYVGAGAGYGHISGHLNTFIGRYAGWSNNTGNRNIFLGARAGYNETGSNRLYIDNSDTAYPLIYGEFDNNVVKIHGTLITASASPSDGRYKKDVAPIHSALDKVQALQGVSYHWDTEVYPDRGFAQGTQIGLIAQEVEQVLPELVRTDGEGYKSLSYDKLTAVLVEAVKEQQGQLKTQSALLDEQRTLIARQQEQIQGLVVVLKRLKAM